MANKGADKPASLEDRVEALEKTLWKLGVVGSALGIGLAAFLGFTWSEIPDRARDALAGAPVLEAERIANQAAEEAQEAAKRAKAASGEATEAAASTKVVPVGLVDGNVLDRRLANARIETHVERIDADGGSSRTYSCPKGMRVLSCMEVLISSGNLVCGPAINDDLTSCSYGGCNQVPSQKWRLTVVCGRVRL